MFYHYHKFFEIVSVTFVYIEKHTTPNRQKETISMIDNKLI